MRRSRLIWCLPLAAIALFFTLQTDTTVGADKASVVERKARRAVEQSNLEQIKRHNFNLNNLRSAIIDDRAGVRQFDRSIVAEGQNRTNFGAASSQSIPPSPGLVIGHTLYDYQHNYSQGYQVARMPGADVVHFVWHDLTGIPGDVCDPFRNTYYNSYSISSATLNQGPNGTPVGVGAWSGYPGGDVFDDNTFHVAMHSSPDLSGSYDPFHFYFPTPGSSAHVYDTLDGFESGGCPMVMWPRLATSRDGGQTVHYLAHSNAYYCATDLLWYWRHNGTDWTGPVVLDSTPQLSYVLADDPTGDKLAVAVHVSNYTSMNGINNVAYYESTTDGAGWIAGSEPKIKSVITNYNADAGPGAWSHLTTAYDNAGILHIVWDEQEDANDNAKAAIRHWNSQRQTARTVALGYYETEFLSGVFNLNLAKITLGIGDGSTMCLGGAESNEDYLYVLYTQFGGPTPEEAADHSLGGCYNGELYLTVSATGGNTWSSPVNLTNTKTPNCNPGVTVNCTHTPPDPDSVCRSEHWATIGMAVSDIDIFFISDLDAGGIAQGEGTWQLNPVHYLRIPGGATDAQHLCPLLSPNFEALITSSSDCEYHATPLGQNVETLTIMNLGNAELNGTVSVIDFPGMPTLTVIGAGPYTIPAGTSDLVKTVTMASNSAPEGLYSGEIIITHNDPSEVSPRVIPIDFFVFQQWFCPEALPPMMTGATGPSGPGSLYLEITNTGTFGSTSDEGALWRRFDSSSAIAAASVLVAHGPQLADTTVYLDFYNRASNGQNGFRPLDEIVVIQDSYGSNGGYACATSTMCTSDSVVGVKCSWAFPQRYDRDEVVFARYQFYRHRPLVPVENVVVGLVIDMDVYPARRLGAIQAGATNTPGSDMTRNLLWQQGTDTCCTVPGQTASRFRAGIAVPGGFYGARIGNANDDLLPGGGPTDGYLYNAMTSLIGADLFSDSATDLYTLIALDRDQSISPNETLSYYLILASDTTSEASLKAIVDQAVANAPNMPYCPIDFCDCWADPHCDSVRSDVLDVVKTIDVAFRGAPIPPPIQGCLTAYTDVNYDYSTDVIDVVRVVNVAFRGGTVAANYVNPWGGM